MNIYNINDITRLVFDAAITVGMFDGVHVGHRQMVKHLAEMAKARNLEPVVVTFRNHPRSVLQRGEAMPLLTTFEERMGLMESCGVECVVAMEFDEQTAHLSACEFASRILVEQLNMKMLLLGYDNKFGSRINDDFGRLPELGERLGFAIEHDQPVLVDGVDVSSTKIRKALAVGDIVLANRMLGRAYSLSGIVEHGHHNGTGLGFPTANISLEKSVKLLPADGVYALKATVDGSNYAAMANLGGQPTFGQSQRTLEVHLCDFQGDLYDRILEVSFLDRIRDIKYFDNHASLAEQLLSDREIAIQLYEK